MSKYTTCQLVQGGVIRGYVHLIGAIGPTGTPWPLCDQPQVRLCQDASWRLYLTESAHNCPRCAKVTDRVPLAIDPNPAHQWTGALT